MQLTLINSSLTAEIDEADAMLAIYRWSLAKKRDKTYAVARIGGRRVYLHRVVMTGLVPRGMIVDHHPDPNGLNCKRANLRVCTRSQNMGNSRKHNDGDNQFKGVCFEKATGKYVAQICADGKRLKIGRYKTPKEAAEAYDAKAKQLFKEYAKVNL